MSIRLPGRDFCACFDWVLRCSRTAAVAGSGVGGVFNLGQTNTVNARTLLQGNTNVQRFMWSTSRPRPALSACSARPVALGCGGSRWDGLVYGQAPPARRVRTTDSSARQHRGTDLPAISGTPARDGSNPRNRNPGLGAGATGSRVSRRQLCGRRRVRRAERRLCVSTAAPAEPASWCQRQGRLWRLRRLDQSRRLCRLLPEPQGSA